MFRISNTWYLLFWYILHWILFSPAFFRSWKRSILKSCSNKWNKDWFAQYFPLEKKISYANKRKDERREVVFAQSISTRSWVKHSKPSVNMFLFLLECTSIYLYSSFQLLFIVSIHISLTTFSRYRGALSRRQKEESKTRQFIRNSLH